MSRFDANEFSLAECHAELEQLFPHGFAGSDVVREIAPAGWEHSPLVAVFHPSSEQCYEESLRMHQNICALRRPDDPRPLPDPPTRAEFAQDSAEPAIETERDVRELVGQCLWDVFSDNHDVVAPDGRVLHLGSFRAAGGFLAEFLNRRSSAERYDYMNFYLGTVWVSQRADLTPVYQMIFRRLKSRNLDWVYHFPKLELVDFRPLQKALQDKEQPDWLGYSPSEAFAAEEAEKERDREIAEMRESLEADYREAVQEALQQPLPKIVAAYCTVYGRWPRGWPPGVS